MVKQYLIILLAIFKASYYAGLELGIQNFKVRFKNKSADNVSGWTAVDDDKICVYFYFRDIINVWKQIESGADISFKEFVYRLARHEFRHVWQAQCCFAAFLRDGQLIYRLQLREADANAYALGYPVYSAAEFEEAVEYNLRLYNVC